ncbi:MAG: bifunctional adenosylcobinamide kinase/adenosylcobinamide-phosphate guanylyltransferase [Rhodospirillales bacterium]|nr:bifunctional adenosylcobinamide kinase/adenosylcobinamide-phosphate guanylyltransferase [Rhodospirillales bacterium]
MSCPLVTLLLGGARSGKSRYAESLVTAEAPPWTYIATAEPFDNEMKARIEAHKARRTAGWRSFEAPRGLAQTLQRAPSLQPLLIDCLTLWLSNILLGDLDLEAQIAALEEALAKRQASTVLVANEVGLGIVPENALARRFRDEAGWLNQRLAAKAGRVIFMVAGMPMIVKDRQQ